MIVYVRFNSSHGFPVELEQVASVAELKETVGRLQGVEPDQLRVIFAGRELCSESTLQSCDLPEQSTVHVVLPPSSSARRSEVVLQRRLGGGVGSLTRLDLSSSRLTTASEGLAVILETDASGQRNQDGHKESRSHSSFHVFCKTICKAIQPGKLRVRCRDCKQGTLTLNRVTAGCSSCPDLMAELRMGSGETKKLFAMDFLSTARHSAFAEAELKVIFNSCLDEPFEPAEMRRLRSLGFIDQLQIAMDRKESRELSMAKSSAGLAMIPKDQALQIGVMGLSPQSASSPPSTSLRGQRQRRESWDSPSDSFSTEPTVPAAVSLPSAPLPVGRSRKKKPRRGVPSSPAQVPSPEVPSPEVPSPEVPSTEVFSPKVQSPVASSPKFFLGGAPWGCDGPSGQPGCGFSPATGTKPGPATGTKPGPATGTKPGPATGTKPGPATGTKPGPAAGVKPCPFWTSPCLFLFAPTPLQCLLFLLSHLNPFIVLACLPLVLFSLFCLVLSLSQSALSCSCL
ncbi:E3 ubiquitin-protein ligase parkin isoform X1 [Triplophysa dalaica]|uniref:E3 ubiquitin-protein ligase parkin isoform X1 n=1 Tax=Triplophysa dalaica TaxID=1582913 RepID=UPI0024DFEBB1|nr:E3 ubiquitin-protein ligase parkin isoform X1 [Triplophysa dalaica]